MNNVVGWKSEPMVWTVMILIYLLLKLD